MQAPVDSRDLTLHEQLLLLSLGPRTGKPRLMGGLWWGLSAAVIAQLQQDGHVVLMSDARNPIVKAVEGVVPTDPLCESFHRHISYSRKPRKLSYWRRRFQVRLDVHRRTAERLVERGVLEKRLLTRPGQIKDWAYPERDPRPETQLQERIRTWAADPDGTLDSPLEALLSLLVVLRLVEPVLGRSFARDNAAVLTPLGRQHPLAQMVSRTRREAHAAMWVGIGMSALQLLSVTFG